MNLNISIDIQISRMQNTESEVLRLTSFLQEIDDIFHVPLSHTVELHSYAKKLLRHGVVLIAENNDSLIGVLLGYANDMSSKMAYMSCFGILEEYRSYGIGANMLATMKNICRDKGMKKVSLYTHRSNLSAVRFYTKFGFITDVDPENHDDKVYLVCDLSKAQMQKPYRKLNTLVTALGSFAADIVIKTLKGNGYGVIGCDINPKPWIADSYNVDYFHQGPLATQEEKYVAFIKRICKKHDIRYVLPLTDPEVDVLSRVKDQFDDIGVCICASDAEVVKLCRNKYALPKFLLNQGIENIIPTKLLDEIEKIESPVFVKPIFGRSSEGCRVAHNNLDYNYLKNTLPKNEYIVQPLMSGNVLTVDVIREPQSGQVICISRRELLRNKSGAGITVEIIHNKKLDALCTDIASKLNIVGAVNFEFFETNNGDFYLLEVNPRFSGGVEFSHLAGYDVVSNHIKCFENKKISPKQAIKRLIITKKYEEYVTAHLDNNENITREWQERGAGE